MDLAEVRTKIDAIDAQMLDLFCQRMALARDVAQSKIRMGKAVFEPRARARQTRPYSRTAPEGLENQAVALFSLLMSMNKAAQLNIMQAQRPDAVSKRVRASFLPLESAFPSRVSVCCQGSKGPTAKSPPAGCSRFPTSASPPPSTECFAPLSRCMRIRRAAHRELHSGSVNAVYDLLGSYGCSIVRALRLKIDHNLLALPGVERDEIKEVISHNQALNQCAGYLENLGVRTTVCENTARAAELVASSGRHDLAALSSLPCAELYGLNAIERNVQDSDANYTRFVVIAREPPCTQVPTRRPSSSRSKANLAPVSRAGTHLRPEYRPRET